MVSFVLYQRMNLGHIWFFFFFELTIFYHFKWFKKYIYATFIDLTISRKPKFIMLTILGFETINKNTNGYKESSHFYLSLYIYIERPSSCSFVIIIKHEPHHIIEENHHWNFPILPQKIWNVAKGDERAKKGNTRFEDWNNKLIGHFLDM